MKYSKENIIKLFEKILKSENNDLSDKNIFLTDVKISGDNRITVLIDSFEGIKIKDCALISKKIEQYLDREKEDFELVVSSAGLDNPFTVHKQYEKNIGKLIKVLTTEGKRIKGRLISVSETEIEIESEIKKNKNKKNKTKVENKKENLTVAFNRIKEAKIVITI